MLKHYPNSYHDQLNIAKLIMKEDSTALNKLSNTHKTNKYLIYFVIGGDPNYKQLLQFAINSIKSFPQNQNIDITVICENGYQANLEELRDINVLALPPMKHPSLLKTQIFHHPHLHEYNKVLFLDCDIVVFGSLQPIFDTIKQTDCLYVVPEGPYPKFRDKPHECPHHHRVDRPYTQSEINLFTEKGIKTFNAGQFGFSVSKTICSLFQKVASDLVDYNREIHIYEQPFMNDVFNRNLAVNYDLGKFVRIVWAGRKEPLTNINVITHFVDASSPWQNKLEAMRKYWHQNIKTNN